MTTMEKKIELQIQTIGWKIESCEKEMEQAKRNMADTLTRNDLDIASFMEQYSKAFTAAYEKRKMLVEEQRMLQFIMKTEAAE